MPRGVDFEIAGLSGFIGDVDALRDDIRSRLEVVYLDTANAIQHYARLNASRDRGNLIAAIQVGGRGLNRLVGLADQSIPSRGGRNSAHLNPWVYGEWVERGLKNRNMGAQPFMGPAADRIEPEHHKDVEVALNGALT